MQTKSLRASGFTLIETLMALLVLVIVLGGSLVVARSVTRQAQTSTRQTEMGGLADEQIESLRIVRDANPSALASIAGTSTVKGVAVAQANSGSLVVSWCGTGSCANAQASAVSCPEGCASLGVQFVNYGGEILAVSKQDPAGSDKRAVISLLNPGSGTPTVPSTGDTSGAWDFYVRSTSIAPATGGGFLVTAIVSSLRDPSNVVKRQGIIF